MKFWLTFRQESRSAYILAPAGNYYTWIDGEHTMISCFRMADDEFFFAPDNRQHITQYWRGQEYNNWQIIGFETNIDRLKWWLDFLEDKNPPIPNGFKLKPFPTGMKFESQVDYIRHIRGLLNIPDGVSCTDQFIQEEYEKKYQ